MAWAMCGLLCSRSRPVFDCFGPGQHSWLDLVRVKPLPLMRMYLESCLPATAGEYAWCSCFWEYLVCISREARLECNIVSWIRCVSMVKDVTSSCNWSVVTMACSFWCLSCESGWNLRVNSSMPIVQRNGSRLDEWQREIQPFCWFDGCPSNSQR